MKKNILRNKIIINTVGIAFLLNAACTNRVNKSNIEVQGEGLRQPIQVIQPSPDYELNKDSKISRQDLVRLENFLLNSSFPTVNKVNVIQEYVNYLSEKYNVTRFEVVREIEDYFQVPVEGEILAKLKIARPFLTGLKNNIAANSGIIKPINELVSEKIFFAADSEDVKSLRNLNYYEQLKLEMAIQKAQKTSLAVFKSFDEDAKKLANQALADIAKTKQKDLVDKVKWIATLKEKEKRVESLKLAAEMASKTDINDESEKKAMTAYFYSAIQEGAANPKQFDNDLLLNITDPKILNSAANLGKISRVIAKYSEAKRDKLLDVSKQLNQFSKDGQLKIDLTDLTGNPEFKKHANEFGKKVAGYVDDGQELLNIAKVVGVDPEFCDKAQQAIDVVGKGVQLVAALSSPNPLAVVGAVSGLLGGGSMLGSTGPSRTELELKQLQAKMDMMITLQNRTLDEIAKTRQDIEDLKKLTIKLVELVGSLSEQVAESSRVLFNEIEMVSGVVKQVRELTQSSLRLASSMCITMDAYDDYSYVSTNSSDRAFKINLDQCLRSMIAVDYLSKPQLDIFKSTDKEASGDIYLRSMRLAKLNLQNKANDAQESFKYYSLALNPISNIKNYISDLNSLLFISSSSAKNLVDYTHREQARSDDLLDFSYVTAFTNAVTKLAPFLTVYTTEVSSGVEGLVTDNIIKVDNLASSYDKILNLINLAIIQRSFMDGVQVSDFSIDEMKKMNAESDKNCSLNQDVDSKRCFFKLNKLARKNLLKLMLIKEMLQKNTSFDAYSGFYSTDSQLLLTRMKSYFDNDIWKFEIKDAKVMATVVGEYVEVPTAEEMTVPEFSYSLELKLLLAARENLIELLADMRQNRIPDEGVRRLLMQATLRKAL